MLNILRKGRVSYGKSSTMRLLQITDLHIGQEGEDTYGVDVRHNFQRILQRLRNVPADYLVVSGDLCYRDGEASIYSYVRQHLDQLDLPYFVLSGNHDDPALLSAAFGQKCDLQAGELYYCQELEGRPTLFLDTTPGWMSERQLAWIANKLQHSGGQDLMVHMHHPPVFGGVPFMDDNHPLHNRDAVQTIFHAYPGKIYVFCGHYHVDKVIQQGNITVHITPSLFFQIDQHQTSFRVDHTQVGFREINFDGSYLSTSVHYLPD